MDSRILFQAVRLSIARPARPKHHAQYRIASEQGTVWSMERMPECGSSRCCRASPKSAMRSGSGIRSSRSPMNAISRRRRPQKPQITRNVLPAGITDSAEIDRLVRERVSQGLPIYEMDIDLLHELEPDLILTQELCPVCAVSYDDVTDDRPHPATHAAGDLDRADQRRPACSNRSAPSAGDRTRGVAASVVDALRHRIDWITRSRSAMSAVRRAGSSASNGSAL